MTAHLSSHRRWAVALLLGCALLPLSSGTPAGAQPGASQQINTSAFSKSTSKLSSRLERLAAPSLNQQSDEHQARALGVAARGPGSLSRNSAGDPLTYIRVAGTGAAAIAGLQQAGAHVVHVAPAYGMVTAYVPASKLHHVAALATVRNISEVLQPLRSSAPRAIAAAPRASVPAQSSCGNGIVSEGDTQLRADVARQTYGVSGAGITIGVVSDSYDKDAGAITHAADDIASGDLPGPGNPCGKLSATNVISESTDSVNTDEGRAMLQIVHDLAPDASLAFATANNGLFAFADNVRALRSQARADVIVDDIGYLTEPFFQDGPADVAIQDVTNQGVAYTTATGNDNIVDNAGNNITSYEAAAYRPTACPPLIGNSGAVANYAQDCHNFNPAGTSNSSSFVLAPGASFIMILQWAEPWYGVATDLDMYLADATGRVLAVSNDTNTGASGSQFPVEGIQYQNASNAARTVRLVVGRASGSNVPRLKTAFTNARGISAAQFNAANSSDTFGPSVYGHAGAASALSVAAVPYNNANAPEPFSSYGPRTVYFAAAANATPAQALAAPVVRAKPDIAATDGVATTFFGQTDSGAYRFYGTSAAAPHAAAVAALLKERANREQQPFSYASLQRFLAATAAKIGDGSMAANGAGLIDAAAALEALIHAEPPLKTFLPLQMQRQ